MCNDAPHFNGPEYCPEQDQARLLKQHERVKIVMADGVWRTLAEIANIINAPPASVSAQLRHLRKPRFGAHVVEKRRRGLPEAGLYEYRLILSQQEFTHLVD